MENRVSVRPCSSEDVQASAGTLHPCTGESGGSTGDDTALGSYLGRMWCEDGQGGV